MTGWRSAFHDAPTERPPRIAVSAPVTGWRCHGCNVTVPLRAITVGSTTVHLCPVCRRDLREALR